MVKGHLITDLQKTLTTNEEINSASLCDLLFKLVALLQRVLSIPIQYMNIYCIIAFIFGRKKKLSFAVSTPLLSIPGSMSMCLKKFSYMK